MIWNGTDPLQPDHEVAYREWPTEMVNIICTDRPVWGRPIVAMDHFGSVTEHERSGLHCSANSRFDLIPLQQEQQK